MVSCGGRWHFSWGFFLKKTKINSIWKQVVAPHRYIQVCNRFQENVSDTLTRSKCRVVI